MFISPAAQVLAQLGVALDVANNYLTQREHYRLGLLATLFYTQLFLLVGTPWVLRVGRQGGQDDQGPIVTNT